MLTLGERAHSTMQSFNTTMGSKELDRLDSLSIVTLFLELKPDVGSNDDSAGMTKSILQTFLKGNAFIALEISLHIDAVHPDSLRVKT